jgi:hypothetical protein
MILRVRFLLVHSPAVGPSTWEWVAGSLRSQGHEVLVPNLIAAAEAGDPRQFAEDAAASALVTFRFRTSGRLLGVLNESLAYASVNPRAPDDGAAQRASARIVLGVGARRRRDRLRRARPDQAHHDDRVGTRVTPPAISTSMGRVLLADLAHEEHAAFSLALRSCATPSAPSSTESASPPRWSRSGHRDGASSIRSSRSGYEASPHRSTTRRTRGRSHEHLDAGGAREHRDHAGGALAGPARSSSGDRRTTREAMTDGENER